MALINPKMARHVLQEHNVSGRLFIEMRTATQMALMADFLSKQKVGPFTREEFLKAAAAMVRDENRRNNPRKDNRARGE